MIDKKEKSKIKRALELYEETLGMDCTCGAGECHRCSKIEKARSLASAVIGDYRQE